MLTEADCRTLVGPVLEPVNMGVKLASFRSLFCYINSINILVVL